MVFWIILLVVALFLAGSVLYSVFCWTPSRESRKEEREEKEDGK